MTPTAHTENCCQNCRHRKPDLSRLRALFWLCSHERAATVAYEARVTRSGQKWWPCMAVRPVCGGEWFEAQE